MSRWSRKSATGSPDVSTAGIALLQTRRASIDTAVSDTHLTRLAHSMANTLITPLNDRAIYREFFPRGITVLDNLDQKTLGSRPALLHAIARAMSAEPS